MTDQSVASVQSEVRAYQVAGSAVRRVTGTLAAVAAAGLLLVADLVLSVTRGRWPA
ncbi:MAG: hypothetical protein GX774_06875 [Armatimonadetes bacterium]|jgi:hypothetical protein|nr:hypothetical protein [Armatimonadota bacterium]